MNPIIAMLKEHNISDEKINELFQTLTDNPLNGNGCYSATRYSAWKATSMMGLVMTQPDLIKEAVDELGLDFSKVEAAKSKLKEGL